MSYEYKLVFNDNFTALNVINEIAASLACVRANNGDLYLKDHTLDSKGAYDIRLSQTDQSFLWLQVNFSSAQLYALLQNALSGKSFKCLEDGDDDVGLDEALRIKGHHA